ncbi:unnamed protein product [Caenorhabditis brenneri]
MISLPGMSRESDDERNRNSSMRAIRHNPNSSNYNAQVSNGTSKLSYFEVGVWQPVPVEKKKSKRHRAERKPHEVIDYDNIDYNSHLTPKIQNMKPSRIRIPKPRYHPSEYDNVHDCFCHRCLLLGDLSCASPSHAIFVSECCRPIVFFIVENAADALFKVFTSKIVHSTLPKDLARWSVLQCNFQVFLKKYKKHCDNDSVDVGIVSNQHFIHSIITFNLEIERRLHYALQEYVRTMAIKMNNGCIPVRDEFWCNTYVTGPDYD